MSIEKRYTKKKSCQQTQLWVYQKIRSTKKWYSKEYYLKEKIYITFLCEYIAPFKLHDN